MRACMKTEKGISICFFMYDNSSAFGNAIEVTKLHLKSNVNLATKVLNESVLHIATWAGSFVKCRCHFFCRCKIYSDVTDDWPFKFDMHSYSDNCYRTALA